MAKPMSLQDIVKQSKALSAATTDQLAANKGLAVPPVSAVGVGSLGGTSQQQAMAGTPAQKKGAIASALAPAPVVAAPSGETGLEKARTTQAPAALDQAKQAEMQRYSQSLGTYGDKINQWIEGAVSATLATTRPTLELTATAQANIDAAIKALPPEEQGNAQTRIDDALIYLRTPGGLNNEALARQSILNLNQVLGKDTTDKLLQGTEYAALWRNIEEGIGAQTEASLQAATLGADRTLTLSDIENLGTSYAELGQLLGLTEDEAKNLSLTQLRQRLTDVQKQAFSETAQTSAQMESAFLSETERQALRGTMRQLEESGIAGIETQFQQLLDDVDAGQQVTIGNQNYTIDQLLADGTFSDLIGDFYAGTDPELIASIKQQEPDLYKFLTNNQNALVTLRAAGEGRTDELRDFNMKADQDRKAFEGTDLLSKSPLAGDDKYKLGTVLPVGTALDWARGGQAISDILSLDQAQRPAAVASLSQAVNVVEENKGSPADVAGIFNIPVKTLQSPTFKSSFTSAWIDYNNAVSATRSNDAQTLANAIFTDDVGLDKIAKQLQEDALLVAFGQEPSMYWKMDTNKNGVLDLNELRAQAQGKAQKPNAVDIAAGKPYTKMDSVTVPVPRMPEMVAPLQGAWADGKITSDELSGFDLDTMATLFNALGRPGEKSPAKGAIAPAIRQGYINALTREKNATYKDMGLDTDGFVPGLKTAIADALFTQDVGRLRETSAVLQGTMDNLAREMQSTTNPDLRWRFQQDYDKLKFQFDTVVGRANEFQKKPSEQGKANPALGLPIGDLGTSKVGQGLGEIVAGIGEGVKNTTLDYNETASGGVNYYAKKAKNIF